MLVVMCGCAPQDPVTPDKPNLVLIVADDLGYTDLGAFGGEIETPNLDALAYDGLRLTNFHAGASCAPTRAMLMTGTDHHVAGMGSQGGLVTANQSASPVYANQLRPDVPTIAERLGAAGYRTYTAAKWHLGHDEAALPHRRGFDRSFVLLEGGGGHFDATPLFEHYERATWLEDGAPITLPQDFYSSDDLVKRLLSYIEDTPAGQPYFAYLGFTAPHWPLQAPEQDIEKYRGRYARGWDHLREQRMVGAKRVGVVPQASIAVHQEAGMVPWASLNVEDQALNVARMEVYAAMVERLDKNVGTLLEALRLRGELDNTYIVFMSDNGAEAHDMEARANVDGWVDRTFDNSLDKIGSEASYVVLGAGWARAGAAPFRASKSKVSEGGVRVPAFVWKPGQIAAGVDDTYMRAMDIPATFAEIGEAAPAVTDAAMLGRSLLERWHGGAVSAYDSGEIVAYEVYGRRSAVRGPWKVLLQEAPYGTGEWQLYNLEEDLGEQIDLSETHPEIKTALIAGWQRFAEEVGVILPDTPITY